MIFCLCVIELFLITKSNLIISYDTEMWKYSKILKFKSKNPLINHEHVKNKKANLQNVDININSMGMRGDEGDLIDWKKAEEKILFIGSSITLGWGVEESMTVTHKLEQYLNKNNKRIWKVLNGGVGNYNMQRYVENYLQNYAELKPNILIIQYFLNDSEILKNSYGNIFTRNFHLAGLIWRYLSIKGDNLKFNNIYEYYNNFYLPENFKYTEKYLKILKDKCKIEKIRCIVAYTPDVQFLNNSKFDHFENLIKLKSEETGFEFVSLTPRLRSGNKNLKNQYNDNHPNFVAHEMMAKTIKDYLIN
tara:strand:- start:5504 stop:6418 length:915 start_codon:yes stop_codon:yes gene_type:complete